ncbi:putative L-tyrosine/L-aspartate decarboxylase [Frankliniella fusca]|uniref:L-tyrosine/L-aspartate decarboxylase n=1 Tax=Frankliniella fusca TaxID=407009 RepID=A0AAE1LR10_9NEOP|nr:putative L-tyrosine/L-aspartate decarboxylase [Frankliniella fusca]
MRLFLRGGPVESGIAGGRAVGSCSSMLASSSSVFFYRDIRFGLGVLPIMYKRMEYDLGFRATTSSRIFPPISSQKPPNFFFLSREKNGLEGSKFDVPKKCPNLGIKSVS